MSSDHVDLSFEQTPDDFVALNTYLVRHSPLSRWPRWIMRFAYPILAFGGVLIWRLIGTIDWIILGIIVACTVFFTARLWNRYDQAAAERARKTYNSGRNATLFGPVRIVISEQGIERITGQSSSMVRWPGFERIASDEDHAFLFLGATSAYVVPRRAFPDGNGFQDFLDRAGALIARPTMVN